MYTHQMDRFSFITDCSIFVLVLLSCTEVLVAIDSLTASRSLVHNETLTSIQGQFQLGFLSYGSSTRFYLGIWYNGHRDQIVWVANRDSPLRDTLGVLKIQNDGNLVLLEGEGGGAVWSSDLRNSASSPVFAQLLDTGNLVLKENNRETVLWQSFDHPSHAMITGMKIGWDLRIGLNRNLTSWKSTDDPAPGEYTYGVSLQGLPQIIIWKGSSIQYRSGPWNGVQFQGLATDNNFPFTTTTVVNLEEAYFEFQMRNDSSSMVSALTNDGKLQLLLRDNNSENWTVYSTIPSDVCATYRQCGPNTICNISSIPRCSCMTGYKPKSPQQWDIGVRSGGCVQRRQDCSERQDFLEMELMKMPDFLQYQVNLTMSLEECNAVCLQNCSCTAYANANASGQPHGCLLWFGDLIDVRPLIIYPNPTLFLRISASDRVAESESGPKKNNNIVIIAVTIAASICLLSAVLFFMWRRKTQKKGVRYSKETDAENLELPLFNLATISEATQSVSTANKVGEGGFGPVYKGKLQSGQEIAVKCMAESSRQGLDEFKNEVLLIAKLQHRNLVRLLGCCIHAEEIMLIYEYMPNRSLDSFIFGGSNHIGRLLVWKKRLSIIIGISRGLLYLHRDSRLRIIHRDLKAGNVLLDSEMNPKISDFGMARTFGEKQLITKTLRVVGTYGYMAPEYMIDGVYSMKSDVFSFGVLVLEIVSGRRNSQFHHPDHDFNLLGHAWKLWLEGTASELIDPLMEDSFSMPEVLRCIQVGLLCVQLRPEDRPDMSSVLQMLDSETAILQQPKRPGFFTERYNKDSDSLLATGRWSLDESTMTSLEGR